MYDFKISHFLHKVAVVTKGKNAAPPLSGLILSLLSAFKQPISEHDTHNTVHAFRSF